MATTEPVTPVTTERVGAAGDPRRVAESRDPATGEVWRTYAPVDAAAVGRAIEAARRAQPAWAACPLRERARVIERFRRALYRRRREAAALIRRENGKP